MAAVDAAWLLEKAQQQQAAIGWKEEERYRTVNRGQEGGRH